MPSTINLPKLRKHPKGSVVVLGGKYVYCGPYGSAEARQKYDRLIAEWLAYGLTRRVINKQVGRIKRMFNWAVENELVPASVHRALASVKGLRKDKTAAREKAPVKPVIDAHIQAVLPFVPPTVRTMILVQQLCGGRPQDLVEMKPRDIDTSDKVWMYRPGRHKSEHHERERIVFLGPRAQVLLKPFLDAIGLMNLFSLRSAPKRLAWQLSARSVGWIRIRWRTIVVSGRYEITTMPPVIAGQSDEVAKRQVSRSGSRYSSGIPLARRFVRNTAWRLARRSWDTAS